MILDADFEFINEAFEADRVTPEQLDLLLSLGWRHFDKYFFRYSLGVLGSDVRRVIPLRIRLVEFSLTKSQRRVLRSNADLEVVVRPLEIDDEAENLFERHKQRFKVNVPNSIYDFLPADDASSPCEAREIRVTKNGKLIAASYFDVGKRAVSGLYGIFEPTEAHRSLGIFTMLKELELAVDEGREFYYQGYAYEGESFYDYKKRFRGTEMFDWKGNWMNFGGFLNAEDAKAAE